MSEDTPLDLNTTHDAINSLPAKLLSSAIANSEVGELGHMRISNQCFYANNRSLCSTQMLLYLLSDIGARGKPYTSIGSHGGHKLLQHLEPGRATDNLGVHGKDK